MIANNVILFKRYACVSSRFTSQCWVFGWNLGRDGLWLQISAAPLQCCQPNPAGTGQDHVPRNEMRQVKCFQPI